jgi:uncharacterized membrane protein YdjX (TVP38/TMEM64 family)
MAELLDRLLVLLIVFGVVFCMNVVPAFAPPTWTVLSFIAIRYDKDILLLALVGAVGATLGRIVLARLSNVIIRQRFLSSAAKENIDHIKGRLASKPKVTGGVFLLYAFSPFPSNYLFMAYGLTGLQLRLVAIPFFLGRVVGYSAWAFSASAVARRFAFEQIQTGSFFSSYFVVTQLLTILLVYVFTKIDWRTLFAEKKIRWRKRSINSE